MKRSPRTMSLRETKARLSEAVNASQGSYVLVTRHGKPAAVIVGVAGVDVLDVAKRFASISSRSER
jgi:prevent-host-death family protein